jgi:hypothetical protein
LDTSISALLNSRRWKIVHDLGEIYRRLLLKPRTPTVSGRLVAIIGEFRAWRENSGRPKDRIDGKG